MRVLLDTNIFIYREDDKIIEEKIQKLLKTLNEAKADMLVHPASIEDLKKDRDAERQKIMLSKIHTYPFLESPPDPKKDSAFLAVIGKEEKDNDIIDTSILYAVYKDAVDFLLTEDREVHRKARKLGLETRVFSISEAIATFSAYTLKRGVVFPPALKEEFVYNLNVESPFFDSLKKDYGDEEFREWFKRISREGRKCWVHNREHNTIGALLIHKIENDVIDNSTPNLPKKKRLKLCTFKVDDVGHKIGELFIKLSVDFAVKNDISEIYLTHHIPPETDRLVDLISDYGFQKVAVKDNGESIFLKKLIVPEEELRKLAPVDVAKRYYPSFYDGEHLKKYVVPIRPVYYDKLFTDFKGRQTTVHEHSGGFITPGNTIKKAYLCWSNIKRLKPADILLFYRSVDWQKITTLCTIEAVYTGVQNINEAFRIVGKRTVYSRKEIESMMKKPTIIILFRQHFHLKNPLGLDELRDEGILLAAPMSISEITDEKYIWIKKKGGIDERFAVN